MKYSKEEILQILKANHNQRIQIEKGLPKTFELQYTLTIQEWIDEFDLVDWKELGKCYSELFQIPYSEKDWRKVMTPKEDRTLLEFCDYLSHKSKKKVIKPIKLFGRPCQEAKIFRHLQVKLWQRDQKFQNIRPSSKIEDYLNTNFGDIIEEVNLIAAKALPTVIYEENSLEKESWKPVLLGFGVLLFAELFDGNWFWGGFGTGLLIVGMWMLYQGAKLPPKKLEFETIKTFRDLVQAIQEVI